MNWHICAIAHQLEQVGLGNNKRLIITVPPRSLKSTMCSVAFPAFVLGHDPTKRLIVVSYSADLAIKHGNDFRTVVNSAEYRAIFPAMRISAMKNNLIDVLRGRFDFPSLRTKVSEQAKLHKVSHILIEDAVVGTGLIQELKTANLSIIPVKPEYDKKIRMAIQAGKFENGQVFFPKEAPWLADLEAELFAFPSGRHDDQVDSISQALAHKSRSLWTKASLDGHSNLMNALYQDAIFGRLAGRPW